MVCFTAILQFACQQLMAKFTFQCNSMMLQQNPLTQLWLQLIPPGISTFYKCSIHLSNTCSHEHYIHKMEPFKIQSRHAKNRFFHQVSALQYPSFVYNVHIYLYIYSNTKIPYINIYFKFLYIHPTASGEQLLGTRRSTHSRCSFLEVVFFLNL